MAKALGTLNDLTGKVAIVTGPTSGIGFVTAQELARKGAKVYLAARNEQKASESLARLEREGTAPGNGPLAWLPLDLADPMLARKAAEEFLTREDRLDILVNNAAMTSADYHVGPLGVQDVQIVNYFSPVVFTDGLLPLMKKTAAQPGADVRIVNVSTGAHYIVTPVSFKTKEDFNFQYKGQFLERLKRYALSKVACHLYANELQRRLTAEGVDIICITLHPGAIYTEGSRHIAPGRWYLPLILLFFSIFFKTALQGATTTLIAAAAPHVRAQSTKYKGAYLHPYAQLTTPSKAVHNEKLAEELWETTDVFLKEWGVRQPA